MLTGVAAAGLTAVPAASAAAQSADKLNDKSGKGPGPRNIRYAQWTTLSAEWNRRRRLAI